MKKTFTMMVAMLFAASTFAQQNQSDIRTATLIHGDQTSVFYGANAFCDAYNAAAKTGDVIVLSSGDFSNSNSVSITKSVDIYGAGYETDAVSGAAPTEISTIYIYSYDDYDAVGNKIRVYPKVRLEGLLSRTIEISSSNDAQEIENLVVRKCRAYEFRINANSKNCKVSQCYFEWGASCTNEHNQLNFENCYIGRSGGSSLTSTITYDHCIIRIANGYSGYAHYTNNIILSALNHNCTAYNNIFTVGNIGNNITGENNWTGIGIDGIFVDAEKGAVYTADNDFALRFPALYVGTDGTEVGINGGNAPFDRISPLPRILSNNIDLRTTADGKLNVSIEVEAQTKE